jgi:glycosyltransferase involved in cell wall biosynthesis
MKLKIAVTSAFSWPYVRRGNRLTHNLVAYLAHQGHEIHFITTKPGKKRRKRSDNGILWEFHPIAIHPLLMPFKTHVVETFMPSCFRSLVRENFDIIQTNLYPDGFAASIVKSIKGTPFVNTLYISEPLYPDTTFARFFFSRIVKSSSRLVVLSNYMNVDLKKEFGITGKVIAPPIDISKFQLSEKKDLDYPLILCTCSINDPRKRVAYLVSAFEKLFTYMPHARLQLAGDTTPELADNIMLSVKPKVRNAIEILYVNSDDVLSALYREAAISVVPSLREPFGMVTAESLASGTPVVGTRSGGTTEILKNPEIGVLFESTDDPDELCQAMLKGLEMAGDPETPKRCRLHAEQYSSERVGAQYEDLYFEVLDGRKRIKSDQHRHNKEDKVDTSDESNERSSGKVKGEMIVTDRLFDDALDELEITYDTYFAIDLHRPRCIHILNWALKNKLQYDNVLFLGQFTRPLVMMSEKLGIQVQSINIVQKVEPWKDLEYQILITDLQKTIEELSGNYDLIVCDDLLQNLEFPIQTIQRLEKKLQPEGIFLMTASNAVRGTSRLRLLAGRNIYPWIDSDLHYDSSSGEDNQRVFPYREYTMSEFESMISSCSLTMLQSEYFIGRKAIDNNWASMPVKAYLSRKIYHIVQKIIPSLRSHIFVAAKK